MSENSRLIGHLNLNFFHLSLLFHFPYSHYHKYFKHFYLNRFQHLINQQEPMENLNYYSDMIPFVHHFSLQFIIL